MKQIIFTLLLLVGFLAGYSQMTNNGGTITVESGATLVIEGSYTSTNPAATLDIDGEVILKGNFVNNGGNIASGSLGQLTFNGGSAQEITGSQSTTFYCDVEVDNAAGVALTATAAPGANQALDKSLILTAGKVTLNSFNLTLSDEGVTTPSDLKYIVTNGAGQLIAPVVTATPYIFPVGTTSTYNPVILNDAGAGDTYGVNFTGAAPAGWTTDDHAVAGTWTVTEAAPGGADLTVTAGWDTDNEEIDFDNTDCAVGLTTDNGTTIEWKASSAATGPDANGTYAQSGAGFTTVGQYVVGDYFFEGIDLDLDLFLAGPYNAGVMSTALNSIIPDDDPYGNGINNVTVPATAVDWIEVELRDATTPSFVEKSYSFFLDGNGNVLNINGNVGAKLTGLVKDQYYVAVRHRNHLGAMTASPINFTTGSSFSFDFTAGTGIYGTNAMRDMGSDWALWAGDANGDGKVVFQGADNDPTPVGNVVSGDIGNTNNEFTYIVNGYNNSDINMDGQVIFQGADNDPTPIGNSVSNHPGNTNNEFTYTVNDQLP
jgi:hypothetical protein